MSRSRALALITAAALFFLKRPLETPATLKPASA